MARYNHREVEPKWRKAWADADLHRAHSPEEAGNRPKAYVLEMFPYPSGRIHVGHSRNYTMGDVIARFRRSNGYNVLHPMGWDAFGLPAENAAMERGVHPGEWTRANIAAMREQLKSLGLAVDWSRESATCDPEYYARQQRLFLDFFRMGLVYRAEADVNWDPVDETVLANEQVIEGKGWRSGALVERRKLSQWFFKITDFSQELLDDLKHLGHWPAQVKTMQINWIGRSEGVRIRFSFCENDETLDTFSTQPGTLFGATFIGISPDHPFVEKLAKSTSALQTFVAECRARGTSQKDLDTAEKRGFNTG